jgi:hypothetical protein
LVSGILNNVVLQAGISLDSIIGIIIGAFATFCFAYLIENIRGKNERKKEIQLRERIVIIVAQELTVYTNFLLSQLYKFQQLPDDRIQKYDYETALKFQFYRLSRFYINMSAETKAKVFDESTLMILERVYQYMQQFDPNVEAKDFKLISKC